MDLYGVGSQSLGSTHVCGQLLQVHLYGVGSGLGMCLGIGCDYGDGISELEYLLIAEDGALPAVGLVVQRQHDKAVDAVLAWYVLCGYDLEHTGHLLGFGGIHALEVCVGDLSLHQGQTQGVFGHMQSVVCAEVPGAGDLLGCGRTDVLGALDALAGGLEDQIFLGLFTAHYRGGVHNRVDDGLIACAAAQVAGLVEPLADFFTGGVGVLIQQHLGADYEAGCAEAALRGAVGHPCYLQRMHVAYGADALDSGYLRIVANLAHLNEAGSGDFTIQNDVAGAALALAAADLAAGEQQALTQH